MTASALDAEIVPSRPTAWGAVYAMSLCVFVLIASEFMPVSLLSPIAKDLSLTPGQAGQSISISGIFAFLTSLLITNFIGRSDRRIVLLAMTTLLIVSGTCVAFAPSYAILMIGRAVLGIAIGGFWSLSAAITMRLVPAESVPKAFAITNGGNAIASIIAAPLGSFVGGLIGWRGAFFCVVPLAAAALIWQAFSVPSLPSEPREQKGRMWALLRRQSFLIGLIAMMVFFMGQFALFTYLRPFLEQVTRVTLVSLSAMLLLVGVSGFIGTVLVGRVIGDRLHILLGMLSAILAVVAIGLVLFGGSVAVTAVLLAIWGFTATAAPVAWWTWMTRAARDDPEAGGALMVAGVQFSITMGAALGGVVFDAFGPISEFTASAAILIIGALLAFATSIRAETV
jgi:predicted MFS family arabinose efflux permease